MFGYNIQVFISWAQHMTLHTYLLPKKELLTSTLNQMLKDLSISIKPELFKSHLDTVLSEVL